MSKVLVIHPDRCTGCRTCELACAAFHEGEFRPRASRVHVHTWEREGLSVPMVCQQCDDAPCASVCPTRAMTRTAGLALVSWDQTRCIRCRMCTLACPFGNASYDSRTGKILKCDNCSPGPGGPATGPHVPECVRFCPASALEFTEGTIALRSRSKAFAAKLKEAV